MEEINIDTEDQGLEEDISELDESYLYIVMPIRQ